MRVVPVSRPWSSADDRGDGVTAAPARPLGWPRRHLDGSVELGPAQRVLNDALVGLAGGKPLDGDLRGSDVYGQIDCGPSPLVRCHGGRLVGDHRHDALGGEARRHDAAGVTRARVGGVNADDCLQDPQRGAGEPPLIEPFALDQTALRGRRHALVKGEPGPLARGAPGGGEVLSGEPERRRHGHAWRAPEGVVWRVDARQ